ncbi:hypothetical protein RRG08_061647 [Elysia crispata]|uniref:Uncharacterized protein n=1 Tax=Elysia crispata TaxID=231223 RepID=A0AAE1AR48_9GAST|nr:hypothetical protein RRG08_061647 [Elysia crispata]
MVPTLNRRLWVRGLGRTLPGLSESPHYLHTTLQCRALTRAPEWALGANTNKDNLKGFPIERVRDDGRQIRTEKTFITEDGESMDCLPTAGTLARGLEAGGRAVYSQDI